MHQILTGIHMWSAFSEARGMHFNGFHVRGPSGSAIIDPPLWQEEDLKLLRDFGRPDAIILTNKDHERRAGELAQLLDTPILIHQADANAVSVPIAETFDDGQTLEAGMVTRNVPSSKSPGETALHLPWLDALVIGDAVIGNPVGQVNLLPPAKIPDRAAAMAGLQRLLELRFDALLLGDGACFTEAGRAALEDLLERNGEPR